MAPLDDVAALAQEANESRDRQFYGWASVAAREAGGNGRRVIASPQDGNPYHADIVLPDSAATDRGERTRHAQELADASCWVESPKSTGASGAVP